MHRRTVITAAVMTITAVLGPLVLAPGAQAALPGRSATADCPVLDEAPMPHGPSGTVQGRRPLFSWSAVPGIDEYVLVILYASDNEEYVIPGQPFTVAGTSFRPPQALPFSTEMRWKVKTECNEDYGPFSPSTYFDLEPRCRPRGC